MRRRLWTLLGLAVLYPIYAAAQAVPPGAAPSCDQQLEMARTENIALRKQLAQNMFQAAFMEEQNQVLRKQVEAQAVKDKAAEKK
jgi:hypothetical protein